MKYIREGTLMSNSVYKRILVKLSGEALGNGAENGEILNFDALDKICGVIKQLVDMGTQVALLVGGGNIWRGARNGVALDRVRADDMGMLATMINCLALEQSLKNAGVDALAMSACEMNKVAQLFTARDAINALESGKVIILGGGTGNPFFTTDTGAILRALEIKADIAFLAKNIDGIYSADPRVDPTAVKYDTLTYAEILEKNLKATDPASTCLAMENGLPILLFALDDPDNIVKAARGESIGTIVK